MENKSPDRKPPRPGIAEAIHPEIGNGVSWESNDHDFLLRTPDASKDLDAHFVDIEVTMDAGIAGDWDVSSKDKDSEIPVLIEPEPAIPSGLDDVVPEAEKEHLAAGKKEKRKTKVKPKDEEKAQDEEKLKVDSEELTRQVETNDVQHKVPKAGKLVRKAAKSIKKQAEKEIEEQKKNTQQIALTESTLSPYTQWLKGLRGSEYVHPYDEDFAFAQGAGPAREGISETFADLLASQGYREQAVEMYLKLMEKYPEKSGFFAAKIEALQ